MKAHFRKAAGGLLVPDTDQDAHAIAAVRTGEVIAVEWKRPRNIHFHRKFFALLNHGFEAWEPGDVEYKGQRIAKNFEQFRNDLVVLAGWYDMSITLKNEPRFTAKSISFGSMDQDEFERLYNAVVDVLLTRILTKYKRADLDAVIERLMQFS